MGLLLQELPRSVFCHHSLFQFPVSGQHHLLRAKAQVVGKEVSNGVGELLALVPGAWEGVEEKGGNCGKSTGK